MSRELVEQIKQEIADKKYTELDMWGIAETAVSTDNMECIIALWELGINFSDSPFSIFSPMYSACSGNHYDVVKLMLELGFDAKSISVQYMPYAVVAADKGHWEIVWMLLENGADVNAVDQCFGNSLLQCAVENGELGTVTRLMDMGADPMLVGEYKYPYWSIFGGYSQYFGVLHNCIPGDHINNNHFCDMHMAILDRISPERRDYKGMTALHIMVEHKCKEGISYLLGKGWPIDQRTSCGNSALHLATCRDEGIVHLLVENGADVALHNNWGETPYQYRHNSCIHHEDMEKLATLLRTEPQSQYPFPYGRNVLLDDELSMYKDTQASDDTTLLHHAIVRNDAGLVLRLLQAGYDPNHRMNRGDTPLRRAYTAGAPISIIRSLLEFGANPELPMQEGRYYYHSDEYTPEVFTLLSHHGADFNQRDEEDHTALYYAEDAETVRILREFGCAPDLQAPDVSSALFYHASMRRWDIVRYLIEQGVNPRLTDDDGRSLLHYVEGFDADTAQFLLDAGLDIDAQDKYGLTPLMRAGLYGDLTCVKWLVNHGADREFTDPNGWKACDWAGFTYTLTSVIDYLEGNDDEDEE